MISAQVDLGGVGDIEGNLENIEDARQRIDDIQEPSYWDEKWDYLGNEWQKLLLKNDLIAAFDNLFKQISIVFRILFGVEYSMSIALLGIFVLWLFVVVDFGNLIGASGVVKEGTGYWLGVLVAIILAQVQVLKNVVLILGRLVFSPEHAWTRFILVLVVIAGFSLLHYFTRRFSAFLKVRKEKNLKRKSEIIQKSIVKRYEKKKAAASKG
ncbi:MAG: hypothetical protein ACE5ES_00030 [Candidatus Nanoarchaeia archaeon]